LLSHGIARRSCLDQTLWECWMPTGRRERREDQALNLKIQGLLMRANMRD